MSTLVNLTGREIVVVKENGEEKLVLPKGKKTARTKIADRFLGEVRDGDIAVDVVSYDYEKVDGLPEPRPGITYVVSWAVLQALVTEGIKRPDVVAPDTTAGSVVRGDKGFVVGVRRFRRT